MFPSECKVIFHPLPPFGWSFSPIIAIETLAQFLVQQHPGQVILIQYLDDLLLISVDRAVLAEDAAALAADLRTAGWKVSPKSDLKPRLQSHGWGRSSGEIHFLCPRPQVPGPSGERVD